MTTRRMINTFIQLQLLSSSTAIPWLPSQILIQEVENDTIGLWSVLVEVEIVARLRDQMFDELLCVAVVCIGWLVKYAWAIAIA